MAERRLCVNLCVTATHSALSPSIAKMRETNAWMKKGAMAENDSSLPADGESCVDHFHG
jgi:hypothetical protein